MYFITNNITTFALTKNIPKHSHSAFLCHFRIVSCNVSPRPEQPNLPETFPLYQCFCQMYRLQPHNSDPYQHLAWSGTQSFVGGLWMQLLLSCKPRPVQRLSRLHCSTQVGTISWMPQASICHLLTWCVLGSYAHLACHPILWPKGHDTRHFFTDHFK
jgi:hypothetical protein